MIPLKCQRCKHEWNYTGGKTKYFVTYPQCKTSVSINKSQVRP